MERSDWWEAADAAAFTERAACFVDEFSQFSGAPGVMLNGKLTVGENISEAEGVRLRRIGSAGDAAGGTCNAARGHNRRPANALICIIRRRLMPKEKQNYRRCRWANATPDPDFK